MSETSSTEQADHRPGPPKSAAADIVAPEAAPSPSGLDVSGHEEPLVKKEGDLIPAASGDVVPAKKEEKPKARAKSPKLQTPRGSSTEGKKLPPRGHRPAVEKAAPKPWPLPKAKERHDPPREEPYFDTERQLRQIARDEARAKGPARGSGGDVLPRGPRSESTSAASTALEPRPCAYTDVRAKEEARGDPVPRASRCAASARPADFVAAAARPVYPSIRAPDMVGVPYAETDDVISVKGWPWTRNQYDIGFWMDLKEQRDLHQTSVSIKGRQGGMTSELTIRGPIRNAILKSLVDETCLTHPMGRDVFRHLQGSLPDYLFEFDADQELEMQGDGGPTFIEPREDKKGKGGMRPYYPRARDFVPKGKGRGDFVPKGRGRDDFAPHTRWSKGYKGPKARM